MRTYGLRFDVNCSMLFTELPLLARPAAARAAGYGAVEQIADPPGRGAPGTGTLDFEPLFAQLAAQGCAGSVGLEYLPKDPSDSSTSFGWL